MEICRLTADEAFSWAQTAAESMAGTRIASGALSRGGAADLMRSIVSTFRNGIPSNMAVWTDEAGSWLWIEYADNSRVRVHGGFFNDSSNMEEWAQFIHTEFDGSQISWCLWGDTDSLAGLVESLEARASVVILGGLIADLKTPAGSSGAWLRPMSAGELMRFQVAAANERGVALAASGEWENVDKARREAFREIESELSDGVASPGHRLYSVCYGGQTIGGAWLEVDGGIAVIRSVVLDSEVRGQGHRRAAVAALAAAAHMEGARYIQTTVIPADHPFASVLKSMGMEIISTDYIYKPKLARTPALVH